MMYIFMIKEKYFFFFSYNVRGGMNMYESYEIQPGDTISSVADKFMISIDDLFNANNWAYMNLEAGEIINIPYSRDNSFDTYIVKKGDTLYSIGKMYDISSEDLALLNGLEMNEYIFPDQKLLVPKEGVRIYITRENDTINGISEKTNVAPEDILALNENLVLLSDQLIVYKEK